VNAVDLFKCGSRSSANPCGIFATFRVFDLHRRAQLQISRREVG
jgi:hypothetical protein